MRHTNASIKYLIGFNILSLLIVESTLGLVLIGGKLSEDRVWLGLIMIVILFILVFAIVTVLFLSLNKEDSNPALEQSALRDGIEDIIVMSVKPECLKNQSN